MINMQNMAFVKGTKQNYRHDLNGHVYNFRGAESKPDDKGLYKIVVGFNNVLMTWEEIFPYVPLAKYNAVVKELDELKKLQATPQRGRPKKSDIVKE